MLTQISHSLLVVVMVLNATTRLVEAQEEGSIVGVEIGLELPGTTTTSHPIDQVPEQLKSPSPLPAPSPSQEDGEIPPLPAPLGGPVPGPAPDGKQTTSCSAPDGCQGFSCDSYDTVPCSVLEKTYSCDCSACVCELDNTAEKHPSPAPEPEIDGPVKSNECATGCVDDDANCDYWEFNTCEYLESSRGCDCSGCSCTGGTCTSDFVDDSDEPECEDWCGESMTQWESCEYCRCKACDFCIVGDDGESTAEKAYREFLLYSSSGHGVYLSVAACFTAAAVSVIMLD